ncbi:Alpha/beta hydrolase fold-1 [Xylariaceae sp. FL0804]|nr:Alpha/beta hydrolase fold-1 [Xylariaceae sp. FL0804]
MATLSIKPVILLAGASGHTPAHYSKVVKLLEEAGYEVQVPQLPTSNGARPPNADLASDTELFASIAKKLADAGHTIAVLTHSYGGMVATNALHGLSTGARTASGLTGGVSHLVFAGGSYALPEGSSIGDIVDEVGFADKIRGYAWTFAEDDSAVLTQPELMLVGDAYTAAHPDEVAEYIAALQRYNGKAIYDRVTNTPAWKDQGLRVVYAVGAEDATVPEPLQRLMIEKLRREGAALKVVETQWAHCPNLMCAKELVDFLVAVISVPSASI